MESKHDTPTVSICIRIIAERRVALVEVMRDDEGEVKEIEHLCESTLMMYEP